MNKGLVYTPNACLDKQCHVHFAFHGCWTEPEDFASEYYGNLLSTAAANDIIVVYPGSKKCHNAEGLFDEEYWLSKDGLYPQTIMNMICRVTAADATASDACFTDTFSAIRPKGFGYSEILA